MKKIKQDNPKILFSDFEPGELRGKEFFKLLDKIIKDIYDMINELRRDNNGKS